MRFAISSSTAPPMRMMRCGHSAGCYSAGFGAAGRGSRLRAGIQIQRLSYQGGGVPLLKQRGDRALEGTPARRPRSRSAQQSAAPGAQLPGRGAPKAHKGTREWIWSGRTC